MGKLSPYARNRVISLQSSSVDITKITDIFQEEGIRTSRSSVSLFLSCYHRSGTGSLQDAPRSRRKQILNEQHCKYIDNKMTENDKLTSSELKMKQCECFKFYNLYTLFYNNR